MCPRQRCGCCGHWRLWLQPLTMVLYSGILFVVIPLCIMKLLQAGAKPQAIAWFVGGIFVLLAVPMAIWEITQHLIHYTQSYLQKYIIRILWMVPIYALNAWLGLMFPYAALYMDTLRECYEAFVIYSFMMYLLSYLLGEFPHSELVLETLARKPPVKHIFPLCFLPPWQMGRSLIERCKHGILQYTVIRPTATIIGFICEITGVYGEGQFLPHYAYPYLTFFNNLSQFLAMYSLVLFYRAHKEELQPIKPLAKFMCIKAVIFFSFFQGFIISVLVWTGVIQQAFTTDDQKEIKALASSLQDFLICIEMFLAAVAHLYAFSHVPFIDPDVPDVSCWKSFLSMLDVSDVQRDVSHHIRTVGSTVRQTVSRRSRSTGEINERTSLVQPVGDEEDYLQNSCDNLITRHISSSSSAMENVAASVALSATNLEIGISSVGDDISRPDDR